MGKMARCWIAEGRSKSVEYMSKSSRDNVEEATHCKRRCRGGDPLSDRVRRTWGRLKLLQMTRRRAAHRPC